MSRKKLSLTAREDAHRRACACAPFLAQLAEKYPEDVENFLKDSGDGALAKIKPPDRADFVDSSSSQTSTQATTAAGDALAEAMRHWRNRVALVTALADLAGEHDITTTTRYLSDFADRACDIALAQAFAEKTSTDIPRGLAVVALGKLGSRELNYSSDIDLILIYDPQALPHREREDCARIAVRIGQRMIALLSSRTASGHVARVDMRLRPQPEVTPIVLSVDAAVSYYESMALPWEQAAFIRTRASAGDRDLGRQFLQTIESFTWRKSLDFQRLSAISTMSTRIRDHYAEGQAFGLGFDLKRGRGGIREVEFFAQVHQMIYGGRDRSLRAPATLDALRVLAAKQRISEGEARNFSEYYQLFRRIEHRLQMIEDQQTHSLPDNCAALDMVARLDGLADGKALLDKLRPAVEDVAATYDKRVSQSSTRQTWPRDTQQLADLLLAAGFDPPSQALARIADWRSGRLRVLRSAEALEALERALPELMGALGKAPDPETALRRFDQLITNMPSSINFFNFLAAQPKSTVRVVNALSLSQTLGSALGAKAALVDGLIDVGAFESPKTTEELLADWRPMVRGSSYEAVLDTIRDRVGELRFAYGIQLLEGTCDPLIIGRGCAALAQAAVTIIADRVIAHFEEAHGRVPDSELVILALGRFGGGMLTHESDLDLVYLFTGDHLAESDGKRPLGATKYYNRLAGRLSSALTVPTAAGKLYEVDTRLRPSGEQGPLVSTLDSFVRYQQQQAWVWEQMALLRARPIYGSAKAQVTLKVILEELHHRPRQPMTLRSAVVAMREKIATHKPPQGPLDIKAGDGGLIDLEFAMHFVQIAHRVAFVPSIEQALAELVAENLAPRKVVAAHALLERMLIILRLTAPVGGEPPTIAGKMAVTRACHIEDWDTLMKIHSDARNIVSNWYKAELT